MLKQSKLKDTVHLYFEALLFKLAFPTIVSLPIGALTVTVSSTTIEPTFSKIKFIKTAGHNSRSDSRLSDLSITVIERFFISIMKIHLIVSPFNAKTVEYY